MLTTSGTSVARISKSTFFFFLIDFENGLLVVQETHFFITLDADIKDQGGFQHMLQSMMEYLQGRGKCSRPGGCSSCGALSPAANEANKYKQM
jgi:hypothetical protein